MTRIGRRTEIPGGGKPCKEIVFQCSKKFTDFHCYTFDVLYEISRKIHIDTHDLKVPIKEYTGDLIFMYPQMGIVLY